MKIRELISEAKGPEMTRRGFLGNILAAAASKGIDPTGLASIAKKLGPNVTSLVDDMIRWIGDDERKYRLLTDWLNNLDMHRRATEQGTSVAKMGLGMATSNDISAIRNKFTKTYRKNNPTATYDDAQSKFGDWLQNFKNAMRNEDLDIELDILRRAKGRPLEFDPIIDMIKSHDMDNAHEMVKLITELPDIHKIFFKVNNIVRAASANRMQATVAAKQAADVLSAQRQTAARGPLASQIDKAKSILNKISTAPEKVKFAIEQQMTAIQNRVAAIESAPDELVKVINDKCEWIKNNIDQAADNPKIAEEIVKQLNSVDRALATLPTASKTDNAELDKPIEQQT